MVDAPRTTSNATLSAWAEVLGTGRASDSWVQIGGSMMNKVQQLKTTCGLGLSLDLRKRLAQSDTNRIVLNEC